MAKDDLIVSIGADIADLEKDLAKAKKELGNFEGSTKKTSSTFSMSTGKMKAGALAVAAAVAAATIALGKMASQAAENIKIQDRWARRLGASTENFSALVAISQRFGVEIDDVGDAMKDLNERIADAARGNKTYEEALQMVGLASKDLINLKIEDQFIKVADAIGKMNNVGDQNFATAELMADAGFRMLEVFRLGEPKIRSMTQAMKDNGKVITDDNVKASRELDKAMAKLSQSSEALGRQILENVVDPLTKLVDWLAEATDKVAELAGKDMRTSIEKIADMENGIMSLSKEMGQTIQRMTKFGASQDAIAKVAQMYGQRMERLRSQIKETTQAQDEFIGSSGGENEGAGGGVISQDQTLANDLVKAAQARAELHQNIIADQVARQAQADLEEIVAHQRLVDELHGIDKAAQEANERLWKAGWQGRMKVMGGVLSQMSSLMQSENRKMFEVGKAATTATAIIDTIGSAQKAFHSLAGIPIVGPALGAAAAGAAVAAGMARVQQIQSTTMGGGGGGYGGSGGGASGSGQAAPEIINQSNFDISFQGEGPVGQDDVRSLIGKINEEIANGAQLGTINVR